MSATPEAAEPQLTVIVAVHDVAAYLPECLDSLLGQSLQELEVIAVDDGSTDECPQILARYAESDPRLRVLTQANAGQGPARNAALEHARGRFVTFCDGDDTVPPRAYGAVLRTLQRSGSDFAVGAVRRVSHGRVVGTPWGRVVHDRDRLGVTLEEFPDALRDIIACNRVFRAEFLRERVPAFRGGIAYEDHVPMLAAYVRAERFDVLSRVTYNWRSREDNTSTGQQKARIENLRDRIAVKEEADQLLREEATAGVQDAWLARVLGVDLPPFAYFAAGAGDAYRSLLAQTYRSFLDRAGPEVLQQVDHQQKVRAWLCSEERWQDLARANQVTGDEGPMPPAVVRDGRAVVVADRRRTHLADLPTELLELSLQETPLSASLGAARWVGDDLEVWGYVAVRPVASTPGGAVRAWLERANGTERIDVPAQLQESPEADLWAGSRHVTHPEARFALCLPGAVLAPRAPGTWVLHLELERSGLTRTGLVLDTVDGAAGDLLRPEAVGDRVLTPRITPQHGLVVRVAPGEAPPVAEAPEGVRALDVVPTAEGLAVHAVLGDEPPGVVLRSRGNELPGTTAPGPGTAATATFRLDDGRAVPGNYGVETLGPVARTMYVDEALTTRLPTSWHTPHARVTARVGREGALRVVLEPPLRDDERGKAHQHRLRSAFHGRSRGLVDQVLFRSGDGRAAAGNPLAVDRAVARRDPDLPRLWAVRNPTVRVPDGAVPVLIDSEEWYDALARSRVVCVDDDLGWWFDRAPGQRVLHTREGQPSKAVGRTLWEARGLGPEAVDLEVARVNAQFGSLLAPNEQAARLYRDELGFTGEIAVTGLPRTDRLVLADRAAVRDRVLTALDVDPATTVVMHAPTYREGSTRVARPWSFDGLDLGRLADALGPAYTVLRREHRVNRAEVGALPPHERVRDVTRYPLVTDLLLAADVAVLDYSSLRFDWAITGRPAVCFVPDLEEYLRVRPQLLDYDRTAPGPQVSDPDALADQLADLAALSALAAPATARVNAEFNALHDGHAAERAADYVLDPTD